MVLDSRCYDWARNKDKVPGAFIGVLRRYKCRGFYYEKWLMRPFWKTGKGRICSIERMTEEHLRNAVGLCLKRARGHLLTLGAKDPHNDLLKSICTLLYKETGFWLLVEELKKRRPRLSVFPPAGKQPNGKWRKKARRIALVSRLFGDQWSARSDWREIPLPMHPANSLPRPKSGVRHG